MRVRAVEDFFKMFLKTFFKNVREWLTKKIGVSEAVQSSKRKVWHNKRQSR
jgi:hypothetical protein